MDFVDILKKSTALRKKKYRKNGNSFGTNNVYSVSKHLSLFLCYVFFLIICVEENKDGRGG